jgi:hypothetical protein
MRLDRDTHLAVRSFTLAEAVAEKGGRFLIENPKDPGKQPFPSMFLLPEAQALREKFGARDICFDQCMVGLAFKKPTQLLTNFGSAASSFAHLQCSHGPGAHEPMRGQTTTGDFVTKGQSRYPDMMCEMLARLVREDLTHLNKHEVQLRTKPPSHLHLVWEKTRPPTAQPSWDVLPRWHEVVRTKWNQLLHNNILELKIAVMALKHLARSRKHWSKRVLLFTDSMVTLGVLVTGRSSSWPLLRLARMAAALQLAFDVRPYWRYIETARNVADGPSRGFGIGHAQPWAAFSERHLEQKLKLRLQEKKTRSSDTV